MSPELQLLPARRSRAVRLARGQVIRLINTHGSQVVDTWAFNAEDPTEYMSMEHTRVSCKSLCPRLGEAFVTTHRRPILTLVADTTPGAHDTLIAACDPHRYRLLGHVGPHDNCTANLHAALQAIGVRSAVTPCPLNLFMNIPVVEGGVLEWHPPRSKPGDHVELRAEMDAIVVFSACPMDLLPINGKDCIPTDAHYRVV